MGGKGRGVREVVRQWMRVLVVSLWKPSVRAVASGFSRE
jgi:hypothetical protein